MFWTSMKTHYWHQDPEEMLEAGSCIWNRLYVITCARPFTFLFPLNSVNKKLLIY
ncbi:putative S-adenosylmethionine-dependent methyltransferase At5g38780 [Bienertia sinuspersici]